MDVKTIRDFLKDCIGENLYVEDEGHIEVIINEYLTRKGFRCRFYDNEKDYCNNYRINTPDCSDCDFFKKY